MKELALNELQTKVSELILDTPSPGKHSARSAISHIKKAWFLRKLDHEMAVFRAITGEEESVTTIFHSLKRLKYNGAEKLNPRNHIHKSAVQPFLVAIENNFYDAKMEQFQPTVIFDTNEKPLRLETRITITLESGKQVYAFPVPPLNFSVAQNGKVYNFENELLELTKQVTINKVIDHIRMLANRRNHVLYASSDGIPLVKNDPEEFILNSQNRIFRNLILYLLIDPQPKQLFVQQVLNAFLEVLHLVPENLE